MILNIQQGVGVLRKSKTIYLYPSGEDSQAAFIILEQIKKFFAIKAIEFIDDGSHLTSLENCQNPIKKNGELWIIHQDKSVYDKLVLNAKNLDIEFFNGIQKCEELLFACFGKINKEESYKEKGESFYLLNYMAYFILHFFISLRQDGVFLQEFFALVRKKEKSFKKQLKIKQDTIGIQRTSFGSNKHLGEIANKLEEKNIKIAYIYGEEDLYLKEREFYKDKCIFFPLQSSYFGCFLNLFKFYVTCLMPHTTPEGGTKYIYVPHAFIDPIATLAQRKRPLDAFYFKRKMGINGYRIISSLSNFKIYKEGFKGSGYEEELVCGGYPSLDLNIKEYQDYGVNSSGGGGDILIAINKKENLAIIDSFLEGFQERISLKHKVYFRPYPGNIAKQENLKIIEKYQNQPWFIYDKTQKLSAEVMHRCCVLIGDHSSLVYTFALTCLKPVILLFKEVLENEFAGVRFVNPLLHKMASNKEEMFQKLEEIFNEDLKQKKIRQEAIQKYREKEVFHLGKSSEFIANFIARKCEEK